MNNRTVNFICFLIVCLSLAKSVRSQSVNFPNDAAISSLISPALTICNGNTPVVVGVRNAGTTVINTVRVNWSLDNVIQTPITLTNALDIQGGTGVNERNVTLGNMNITGPVTLRIWTSNVNNTVDPNTANDSLMVAFDPAMGGNYTINSAAPASATNFQTITAFTNALNTRGVCAPVVATIATGSGPYTGKVTFGNITGASATNTIRLLGNGNTVNVATTTTAGSKEMLLLTGARYVTVDSINFVSTSTAGGWGALVMNNSQYDSITRCKFDLSAVTATVSASNSGILIQGSNNTATGGGVGGNHIYIGRNHVLGANGTGGCYYGIAVATGGNHNNILENNRVENYFYYGIWGSAVQNLKIINNEIVRPNKSASIGIHNAIYVTGACPDMLIDGNRIHSNGVHTATGWSSFYGIRSLADGTAARPIIISNNALYNFKGTSLWLFYINGVEYNKIINNTIEFSVNTGSGVANYAYYFTGTNIGTEFINNIASFSGGGTGNKFGFYYNTLAAAPVVSEMNNFSMRSANNGNQYYGYVGANYATRAAFIAAYPTREINSPDVDPQYINVATGNLTPTNPALSGTGLNVSNYITRDINKNVRPVLPTIGAFEREPTNFNDLSTVVFTAPLDPFCAGTKNVYAVVQNSGFNMINNFSIGWSVNNITQTPRSINTTLVPSNAQGINLDTFLIGSVNMTTPTAIKVWTFNPNGGVDTFNINDTISKVFTPSTFEVVAIVDTVCAGNDVLLTLQNSSNATINAGDVEWYTSADGLTWTLIANANAQQYTHQNLLASRYFKAKYIGDNSQCETDAKYIHSIVVAINFAKGDTVCANEPAILIARGNVGNTIKWYEDSLSVTPLHTGDTFEVNGLTVNRRYWVESSLLGGCTSQRRAVSIFLSSTPSVDLGNDITECMDEGALINLDAGLQNAMYEWDNNHNGRIRVVDRSGTYTVRVYNQLGCEDRDTIVVNIKPNPKSALGLDTSICIDLPLALDAGNDGIRYYWNTGQSAPNIIAEDSGTYVVYITGNNGCVKTDSFHIAYNGYAPASDGIQIRNLGARKFQFNTRNPQFVIGYEWDFGDGSPHSFLQSPTHEYTVNGNYLVKCYISSSCGVVYDTMMVHIYSTSVADITKESKLNIYPNPTSDQVTISAKDISLNIQRITITNVLGQIVQQETVKDLSTVTIPLQRLAAGTYQLIIETNEGHLIDKIIKY